MKIGLDLHGVITDMPEFFSRLMLSLSFSGFEIHIITGGSKKKALEELNKLNIREVFNYTHLFSILDYHIEKGTPQTGWNKEYNNPEFDDEVWDRTKADYCRKHKIDLMVDDSLIYKEYFTTPFARLWTNTNTPKVNKPKRHLS